MSRRQFLVLIVPLLVVLFGFLLVLALEARGAAGRTPWDRDFFTYVRSAMADEFVWGTPRGEQGWDAYFRALNSWLAFDPYGRVTPPREVEAEKEDSSGQYFGIGIRIRLPGTAQPGTPLEEVEIIGVKPEGPADQAGVRVGDAIVGVGGTSLPELCPDGSDLPLQDFIRGPKDTSVLLRLRAPDGAERDVEPVRDRIDTGSVLAARLLDPERGVAYARIAAFQASTARDLRAALEQLEGEGMRALVLDLRFNGGGLMDQALEVADLFLGRGVIVRQRGRRGVFTATYEAKVETTFSDSMPLAVLIDGGSASASEILAGALQDHGRAVLVGERTYGKFLVQVIEEVPMEAGTVLFRRTTSIYETPSGHHYARTAADDPRTVEDEDPLAGLEPELFAPLSRAERGKLFDIFQNQFYADWNPDEEPVHPDFVDRQIGAALALLRGEPCTARIVTLIPDESPGDRHVVR